MPAARSIKDLIEVIHNEEISRAADTKNARTCTLDPIKGYMLLSSAEEPCKTLVQPVLVTMHINELPAWSFIMNLS